MGSATTAHTWVLTHLSSDSPEFWLIWVLTHLSSDSPEFWLTWVLTHLRVSMYEWIKTSMKGRSRLNASQTSIILTQDIFGKLFETLMNIVVRTSIAANVWWHSYSLLSCNCSNITLITCEVDGDYRLKEEWFEKVGRMADNVQQNCGQIDCQNSPKKASSKCDRNAQTLCIFQNGFTVGIFLDIILVKPLRSHIFENSEDERYQLFIASP